MISSPLSAHLCMTAGLKICPLQLKYLLTDSTNLTQCSYHFPSRFTIKLNQTNKLPSHVTFSNAHHRWSTFLFHTLHNSLETIDRADVLGERISHQKRDEQIKLPSPVWDHFMIFKWQNWHIRMAFRGCNLSLHNLIEFRWLKKRERVLFNLGNILWNWQRASPVANSFKPQQADTIVCVEAGSCKHYCTLCKEIVDDLFKSPLVPSCTLSISTTLSTLNPTSLHAVFLAPNTKPSTELPTLAVIPPSEPLNYKHQENTTQLTTWDTSH